MQVADASCGVSWTLRRPLPTGTSLAGIVSGGPLLVAVGDAGTILTSSDGAATWTSRASGTALDLHAVAWAGSQYVVVGKRGTVLTSPDGIAWTQRKSPTGNRLNTVAWTGDQLVAVGDGGSILTSPDGVGWTRQKSGTQKALFGVVAHGGLIVVVGTTDTIVTSPDGKAWTSRGAGRTTGRPHLNSVVWTGTQFVAMGYWGSLSTSPDGITWTAHPYDRSVGDLRGLAWTGTQLVAVGSAVGGALEPTSPQRSDARVLTSQDGVAWTERNPGTSRGLWGVAWTGSELVAVGDHGTIVTSGGGAAAAAQEVPSARRAERAGREDAPGSFHPAAVFAADSPADLLSGSADVPRPRTERASISPRPESDSAATDGATTPPGERTKSVARAALVPPPQDYVLHFLGDSVAVASSEPEIRLGDAFTLEAWVYLEGQLGDPRVIAAPDDPANPLNPNASTGIFVQPVSHLPCFHQSAGVARGRGHGEACGASPVPLRMWTHLAGTLEAGVLNVFVNGALAGTSRSPGPPPATAGPLTLGGKLLPDGFFVGHFVGALRQVKVWGRALTAGALTASASSVPTGTEQGFLAWWPLDDGAGYGARDGSAVKAPLAFPRPDPSSALPCWWFVGGDGPSFQVDRIPLPGAIVSASNTFPGLAVGLNYLTVDFDSDDVDDIVVSGSTFITSEPVPLFALHGDPRSGFEEATPNVFGGETMFGMRTGVGTIDLDGDGRLDLLAAAQGLDTDPFDGEQSRLFLQTADGRLKDQTATRLPSLEAFTHSSSAADIDGDGDVDVLMGHAGQRSPKLYVNEGSGSFSIAARLTLADPFGGYQYPYPAPASCLADVRGGGAMDALLGGMGGPEQLLLNDGKGNFQVAPDGALPPRPVDPSWTAIYIASADFDGDGWTDFVISLTRNYKGLFLQLLLNNRDGTFRDASDRIPHGWPAEAQAVFTVSPTDLDGDGWTDIVTGGVFASNRLSLNDRGRRFIDVSGTLPFRSTWHTIRPIKGMGGPSPDLLFLGPLDSSYYVARNLKLLSGPIPPPPAATWLLPSSARIGGAAGSYYTTDLAISNTGPDAAWVTAKFLGHDAEGSSGPDKDFQLLAGSSRTFTDVLGSLFSLESGYGAIRVSANRTTLAVTGLTSTPGPSGGTLGQSVAGADLSRLVRGGVPTSILGVREDGAFRTNLVLANPTRASLPVSVALVSPGGATLGTKTYTLAPLGMTQVSGVARDLGASGDVAGGRLVLSTSDAGRSFAAYAAVIDNTTNDPRTLLPVSSGAAILPSSARATGLGGALYTTDLTFSNLSSTEAPLTLRFLGHDGDGRSGPVKSVAIPSGATVTYPDVLHSVFGLESGYGGIGITASSAGVVATSQTSTPGPDGGTFGQSVPVFGRDDLVTKEVSRSIVGVREDGAFRTNLVLANATENTADVDVTLLSDSGTSLGTKRYTLPSLGMTQVGRVVRELGVTADVASARLLIATPTTGGAVAAYASAIDNTTNDPRTLLAR